jgi:conserved hypothetical integral membrane protein
MDKLLKPIEKVGDFAIFFINTILAFGEAKKVFGEVFRQIAIIGFDSLLIVGGSSTFVGLVAALLVSFQVKDYVPANIIGMGIWKGTIIELAPVLTALVIAGRVGGGLASQLGTMRVTEQIDALEVMGINPYRFIVLPRVIASIISIPILTAVATFISISAALIFTTYVYGMPYNELVAGMRLSYSDRDLLVGAVKSITFGIIITFISCYEGFKSEGGAIGVGLSAMKAVVYSSVLILVADFIISYYFYGG